MARVRVLPLIGVMGLAGQGALLALAASRCGAGGACGLPMPGLFMVCGLLGAVAAVACEVRGADARSSRLLRVGAVAAAALLLGLAIWATAGAPATTATHAESPANARALAEAASVVSQAEPALTALAAREAPAAAAAAGGGLVRSLESWAARWNSSDGPTAALPLAVVAWDGAERAGWSGGAQDLAPLAATDSVAFVALRDQVVYRRLFRTAGLSFECQLVLGGEAWRARWAGVAVGLGAPGGGGARLAALAPAEEGPGVVLRPVAVARSGASGPARLLVVMMLAWAVAAVFMVRVGMGPRVWLVPLWLARGAAAGAECHRLLALGWPAQEHPARPGALASLWDPAYFATPVLGGWFASTADAFVTALLVAVSAWQIIGWAGPAAPGRRAPAAWITLAWGGLGGLGLVGLRRFAAMIAANANPRLIGEGAAFGHVSFWVLHAVLLALGLAVAMLLARAAGAWSARRDESLPAGLGRGLAAAVVAGAVLASGGRLPVAVAVTGGAVVAAMALAGRGFAHRAGMRRRLVLPVLVLAVGVWNHGSLREAYAEAERAWLESKAGSLAETDAQWRRFLLGEVLVGMLQADGAAAPASATDGLRAQEPAWNLWRASALHDLGLPCLVELQDADGRSEALFATGFLRDFSYEIADRGPWEAAAGEYGAEDPDLYFRTERRLYAGGEEEILSGELSRGGGRGWLHVDIPVRSWRLETLLAQVTGDAQTTGAGTDAAGRYRPRSEIDRPVLLLHADDRGWLDAAGGGFPGPESQGALGEMRRDGDPWGVLTVDGRRWLCRWQELPAAQQRTPGEGFVLGLALPGPAGRLLDLSRLLLLDLVLLLAAAAAVQAARSIERRLGRAEVPAPWRAGFQERFLAGYLVLGLVLLALVGASVDRVTHERISRDAARRARAGLEQAVGQLRNLLADQARAMARSEYVEDLLRGQLAGGRPLGPVSRQQGMVFAADGTLLLDETLGNLDPGEAAALLAAARRAPLVIQHAGDDIYVGTVIPLELGSLPTTGPDAGAGGEVERGFFYYRQKLDPWLLYSLADLVQGEIVIFVAGRPALASHPASVFSGRVPPLIRPRLLGPMLDHPAAATVVSLARRPFALIGCQPLAAFSQPEDGGLAANAVPALLTVTFPDRERDYVEQRRTTVLFLAGLASIVLLTALALAVVLSWNIFRPLRLLMAATRSLAAGDFQAPLPDPGRDEVGRLAEAFGRMRRELGDARDDLARRERFLATVLDRVTVGVAVLDGGGGVVVLNPAGRQILAAFRPDREPALAAVDLLAAAPAGAPEHGAAAVQLRSEDGRRTVRLAVAPLDLPGGRRDTMLVFEDISDFLEAQKLAINAELARQVAHEIKNPLTPIQLSVQLLGQAWRDQHPRFGEMVEGTVERVLAQVELLRSIAAEFSLLGRPGDLDTAPLNLAALVRETAAAYAAGGGGGPLAALPAPDPPAVLGDADSLRKILGNLMQNSLDAAAEGRPLAVEVQWRVGAREVIMLWSDNGTGIAPDVAERLFDPYFSTKSAGTGLGLAICRNLADRMGGRIVLGNRDPGPGAVAELTLRRADAAEGKDRRT